ncbi:MAG: GGDEF domain-containing protein [Spirochaetales bacterium]|nr:GGDEF domain-containing protein [Spirochaetales bacterium]
MLNDLSQYIYINRDSAGSLFGTLLLFCQTLFLIFQARIFKTERLLEKIIGLEAAFLIYLIGYTVYSSSSDVATVLFWTRVCYTGTLLTAIYGLRLSDSIHQAPRLNKTILISLVLLLILSLWIPGDHYFHKSLNPIKTHSSLIKGPLFPAMTILSILLNGYLVVRTVLYVYKRKEEKILRPLIYGFAGSFFIISFYGVFSAILSTMRTQAWLGFVCLSISLTWYAQLLLREKQKERSRLESEKNRYLKDLIHDKLTGVYTGDYLKESLSHCISQLRRNFRLYALIYIDMDNLKSLNDLYGHDLGDDILKVLGQVLQEETRDCDIPARMGGDEFLLLMDDCPADKAEEAARSIRDRFLKKGREKLAKKGIELPLTLSMGILSSRHWAKDQNEIIHRADQAMYASKKAGKNRITLYHPDKS